MINLSTGPVALNDSVLESFQEPRISHRSGDFLQSFNQLQLELCEALHCEQVFIFPGSGTLANEIMLHQIFLAGGPGLILSNGEFGERLIAQAQRHQLVFDVLQTEWGQSFDIPEVQQQLTQSKASWILFCHCETSTGCVQPLDDIKELCTDLNCKVYVDCMSTIGCMEIDMTGVHMCTFSSGKGIGSKAGLGIVATNGAVKTSDQTLVAFDLIHFVRTGGVPTTISSDAVFALREAVHINLHSARSEEVTRKKKLVKEQLGEYILNGENCHSVFTIPVMNKNSTELGKRLKQDFGILVSYESAYLVKRNWFQLTLFQSHRDSDLSEALSVISQILKSES
ncbi:MAG: aminotransferase class V-fold PLP-dependent enzyme [Flavobacteriales bacterium]